MFDPRTLRILVIQGGGTRGRAPQHFLSKFCAQFGIPGGDLWKYFHVIAGTSSGAMQGAAYAYGYSPDNPMLNDFVLNQSKWVFTTRNFPIGCNAPDPSNRIDNFIKEVALVADNEPFYRSVCRGDGGPTDISNFGDLVLQKGLYDLFGENTLTDCLTSVLIPAYELDNNRFVYFSDYTGGSIYQGANERIFDVTMASGAAPVYLPSYSFSDRTYQDGGLFNNYALQAAISLAKVKNAAAFARGEEPLANRVVVIGLSTGRAKDTFGGTTPGNPAATVYATLKGLYFVSSNGQAEASDLDIRMLADSTLDQLYYYKFENPYSEDLNEALDKSTDQFFADLDAATDATYLRDQSKIIDIYNRLVT